MLLLLPSLYNVVLAQQKEKTVSVSCYVNPELYLQANIIAHVSDKEGKASCNGKYISIHNESRNPFYYKQGGRWVLLKPQGKAVFSGAASGTATSKSPSVLKLMVRYKPDASGSLSARISTISQMNAQTDKIRAREFEGEKAPQQTKAPARPSGEGVAKVNKPQPVETAKSTPAKASATDTAPVKATTSGTAPREKPVARTTTKKKATVKSKPQPTAKTRKPAPRPAQKRADHNVKMVHPNAVGLRIDFGDGATGLGPNYKRRMNRSLSLDAALVFFEGGAVGLGAQVEQSFSVKSASGLKPYIGIGPQFLFGNEHTAIALVPVTGLDYNIPNSALNVGLDWRPSFYLSPGRGVGVRRFGLSLRVAF